MRCNEMSDKEFLSKAEKENKEARIRIDAISKEVKESYDEFRKSR